jgi:hypothetical protein
MRPTVLGITAAALLVTAAVVHARFRLDAFAPVRTGLPGPVVRRTPVAPEKIVTTEPSFGVVAYQVPMPPAPAAGDSVELRFREPLDGAKVSAFASGTRTRATLLSQRIGGDTVVVPLPLGTVDALEVRVHRNLRPPPIVRDVAVLYHRELAATTALAPR